MSNEKEVEIIDLFSDVEEDNQLEDENKKELKKEESNLSAEEIFNNAEKPIDDYNNFEIIENEVDGFVNPELKESLVGNEEINIEESENGDFVVDRTKKEIDNQIADEFISEQGENFELNDSHVDLNTPPNLEIEPNSDNNIDEKEEEKSNIPDNITNSSHIENNNDEEDESIEDNSNLIAENPNTSDMNTSSSASSIYEDLEEQDEEVTKKASVDNDKLSSMMDILREAGKETVVKSKKLVDKTKESERREASITEMSAKYGYTKNQVIEKISRYNTYEKEVRELEQRKSNEDFIKEAIKEKKRSLEDDKLSQGIRKLLTNIQNDIQNDNLLDGIDKEAVYRNNFLLHIKTAILDHIDKGSEIEYDNNSFSKNNVKEVFDIFVNNYNIKTLDLDKNVLISLMLKEGSLKSFVTLLSLFYENESVKESILTLEEEIQELNFSVEKVFYI
ncbi:hypothetical protein [Poseidonibacter ostreae]|uniref:Uncharacterized protein n=1 Tax=Poseidonibacter ostreae TaxID=2654171 RepID=A0A6L4WWR0_9BACT|nr:hypothetical protein [Poseidonibacter ostreae]KAB7891289.1 hypothetical protein GBG19_00200 [Poseidonibacter ostreae]